MNKSLLILLLFLSCLISVAATPPRKSVDAVRISASIHIDGVLDEAAWKDAPVAKDFIQRIPYNGKDANFRTEVRFLYDNTGLYIGATMFDPHPDSIQKQLGPRDSDWLNADDFQVLISPFDDGINGMVFKLYCSEVQADYKLPSGDLSNETDMSWDAVWQSRTSFTLEGWVAEIKIPYSALRFPDKPVQQWGVNCFRNIRRCRESDSWNFVDSKVDGIVNQEGTLAGISDIKPPLRLSLMPYLSGYLEKDPGSTSWSTSYNYGADLKYGLNQSFTLDMTLIPDFGQVQSDDKIYNFSPFEVYYTEKRQFFTEGTELFNKGGLFYSRRVGATPRRYDDVEAILRPGEVITENPAQTQIINATKLSGYTNGKLGIGVFNAMSSNTWATIKGPDGATRRVLTQGFTNYNMLSVNQGLKNNSYFGAMNTNVYIPDEGYSADVGGIDFKFANNKYTWAVQGNGFVSQKFYRDASPDRGYHYTLSLVKLSGNFQFNFTEQMETDTYDPNDLGFNERNNRFNHTLSLSYNIYDPFWKVLEWYNSLYLGYNCSYDGFKYNNLYIRGESNTTTRKQLTIGGNFETNPVGSYDYYEPRVPGWYFRDGAWGNSNVWVSTDYSKKFAIDAFIGGYLGEYYHAAAVGVSLQPRYQPTSRFLLTYELHVEYDKNMTGYVLDSLDPGHEAFILFGRRDINTFTNVLGARYMFNSKMSLSLRARHYWVTADYLEYYQLQRNGYLTPVPYTGNADINYNLFNIDLSYIWEFLPGSQLSVVWKNAINTQTCEVEPDFFNNFSTTLYSPAFNSFSVRVLVYIDALYFKKKSSKSRGA
jgi:hypothetical protein